MAPLAKILEVTTDELLSAEPIQQVQMMPQGQKLNLKDLTLKILVDSAQGDKVRVNLPIELIKVALEIGSKIPQLTTNEHVKEIDFQQIITLVENGVIGNLVEVESSEGDIVHIVVE